MIEILTVCTGNVCRSPLAALLLRARLADLDVEVGSAGVRALTGSPLTPETARLAAGYGVDAAAAAGHRGRRLTEAQLKSPDLVLAMDRTHRRAVVELSPRSLRSTFTLREFARLAQGLTDAEIRDAVAGAGDPHERLRLALVRVSAQRGSVDPVPEPDADDVPDPYRRERAVYERSGALVASAVDDTVRVIRVALG